MKLLKLIPISFNFNIDLWESLGSDTLVYGNIGPDKKHLTVRLSGKWQAAGRKQLNMSIKANSLHFFDTITGKRIEQIYQNESQIALL